MAQRQQQLLQRRWRREHLQQVRQPQQALREPVRLQPVLEQQRQA